MLPEGFEARMRALLGSEYEDFLASFDRPLCTGLRRNPLKTGFTGDLSRFSLSPVPWCPTGFYYDAVSRPGLSPYHAAGLYYLQEPSAMAPAALLDAQPGELENAGAEIIVRDVEGLRSVLLGGTQAGNSAQAGSGTQAGNSAQAGRDTQTGNSAQAGRDTQAGNSAATGSNSLSERYRGSAAKMKTKSGQFWSAVGTSALAMFAYYVISLLISSVILTAVSIVYAIGLQELEGSSYNFWLNVASALSTFGAFIICYGIWHKKIRFHSIKEIDKLSIVPMVILAAAIAIGMNGVLTLTELYRFSPTFQRVSEMQFDTPVWLGIISYGILAPLGEEIVFRGVVYGQLRKVLKVPYAVVLSGLAFGLFHGNLVQAVYATVIGCLLALVYEWYGTIAAPMLFHSVANLFVYVMLELLPFGGVFLSVPSCVLFLVLSAGSLFLLWMLQGKAASRQKG